MRLNPFNPGSIKVRDHGAAGGGFPGGGGGKLGCGGLVVVLIGALVFGLDPAQMLGTMEQMNQGVPATRSGPVSDDPTQACPAYEYGTESCNALDSLNRTWQPIFAAAGVRFEEPTLNFYSQGVRSGCGAAQSAMGPFYCPADHGIYIDTSFYRYMEQQMGAGGDFARYYVMAHEYGHHVQTITGLAGQIRSAKQQDPRRANQLQVLMELHADCYAGVWAGKNRNLIDPGDFEEGMNAASAIGDDRLSGGRASPETFTHGTSAQRMEALRLGMETGDDTQCDRILQGG